MSRVSKRYERQLKKKEKEKKINKHVNQHTPTDEELNFSSFVSFFGNITIISEEQVKDVINRIEEITESDIKASEILEIYNKIMISNKNIKGIEALYLSVIEFLLSTENSQNSLLNKFDEVFEENYDEIHFELKYGGYELSIMEDNDVYSFVLNEVGNDNLIEGNSLYLNSDDAKLAGTIWLLIKIVNKAILKESFIRDSKITSEKELPGVVVRLEGDVIVGDPIIVIDNSRNSKHIIGYVNEPWEKAHHIELYTNKELQDGLIDNSELKGLELYKAYTDDEIKEINPILYEKLNEKNNKDPKS